MVLPLIRDGELVLTFPGEKWVGSIKVQHKSHVPKVMFVSAVSRPDPSHDFDGKIGIRRVCVIQRAQQSTAHCEMGDEYEFDVIIDNDWYQEWYTADLLPIIKESIP